MKFHNNIILIVILGVLLNCQNTTHAQTPEAVKNTFKLKYPGEDDPDWHIDANGNYESNFKINGVKYRADFSPDGTWIETERSLNFKDLPKAIKAKIKSDFGDEKITEIERVESASKGTFYDVEFKRKGKNKDVEFRASGKIIN